MITHFTEFFGQYKVWYADGTSEYLTESEIEKKFAEDRETCRKNKENTPFIGENNG